MSSWKGARGGLAGDFNPLDFRRRDGNDKRAAPVSRPCGYRSRLLLWEAKAAPAGGYPVCDALTVSAVACVSPLLARTSRAATTRGS